MSWASLQWFFHTSGMVSQVCSSFRKEAQEASSKRPSWLLYSLAHSLALDLKTPGSPLHRHKQSWASGWETVGLRYGQWSQEAGGQQWHGWRGSW